LALSLWLIQLLLAAVVLLPVSNSLHDLLDLAPAAGRMVANPDFGWWETLRREHPDLFGNLPDIASGLVSTQGVRWSALSGLRGVGAATLALALLAVVLHAFALGGIFGTLREPRASLVTFGREGMRRLPAFLAFTFGALAAVLAAYRWIYVESGEALRDAAANLDTEGKAMALTAARLVVLIVTLGAIKLLADSVRAIWVARPDLPAISRFLAGIAAALSRPLRLAGVLFFYALSTVVLYAVWLVVDPSAGGEARFALAPLILTQQVFVFSRLLVKVGYYAGVSEALTRSPSPEYAYALPSRSESSRSVAVGDETPSERPAV
jgi:hypothetical protein